MIINAVVVWLIEISYVLASLTADEQYTDWCQLNCENATNIVCSRKQFQVYKKYWNNCFNIEVSMTPEFRRDIILLHNNLRNEVALGNTKLPSASNMRQLAFQQEYNYSGVTTLFILELVVFMWMRFLSFITLFSSALSNPSSWDIYLEASAEAWVTNCVVGMAECRKTARFDNVGQNYYLLSGDSENPLPESEESFYAWASQIHRLTENHVEAYRAHPGFMDDVVQIIWADTYKLGCSEATYLQTGLPFKALVCNYGPGTVMGLPIYRVDYECTACPNGTICDPESIFPHLCARPDDWNSSGPPIDTEELVNRVLSNGTTKKAFSLLMHTLLAGILGSNKNVLF